MTRILHLSDLHFSHITLSPSQFFFKRWIGNANLIFYRKKVHIRDHLKKLYSLAKELKIDLILFSGDASTTGRIDELNEARDYLNAFHIPVLSIPGNHDHYTRKDYRDKTFYRYFENEHKQGLKLKTDLVEVGPINNDWWYLLLDTVIATPIYSSRGLFSKWHEESLEKAFKAIPQDKKILMLNHFPFFQHDSPRKTLKNGMRLHDILKKEPRVKIYAHGHTHRHSIADLIGDNLPVILDAGSVSHATRGTFNVIDLQDKVTVTSYKLKGAHFEKFDTSHFEI